MKIRRYDLTLDAQQLLELPKGAVILTAQLQMGAARLWVLCDDKAANTTRVIAAYWLGTVIPDDPGVYIATVQSHGGQRLYHIFELASQT
jgi:hypothetical protein